MYYRFGSFLALLSFGLITSRHYLSNKNGGDNNYEGGTAKIPSKHKVLEAAIGFGVIGFCFGIGEFLAVEAIHSLKEFISKN